MFRLKNLYRFLSMLVAGVMVFAVFSAASPVYASAGDVSIPKDEKLKKMFAAEQKNLTLQQGNLDKASAFTAKAQALIDKAKAAGKDATSLEAAMGIYQNQIASAQESHNTAASVLSGHSGFDDSGNVVDRNQAYLTVTEAHQMLVVARAVLKQATKDINRAVKEWKQDQKIIDKNVLLAKDYQREQKWLAVQTDHLARTTNSVTRVQDLITKAQGDGKDTTSLENALATYQSQVARAQGSHDTAATILSTHTGFDAAGAVTDQNAALITVRDAGQSLRDAQGVLFQASLDLRLAILEWRQNNP